MQQFLNGMQIQFNAIQSKPYLVATPKPSQSSMFSLEGFIISLRRRCAMPRRRLFTTRGSQAKGFQARGFQTS